MRNEMVPKLRAWDKQDERMSYGEVEYFDDSINYRFDHFCTGADEDVEFMQSAGLKDKNSIEIYEGDIVKDNLSEKYIVKYNRGFCAYFIYSFDNQKEFMAIYPNIILEVIGNIYENPELLEDTKNE